MFIEAQDPQARAIALLGVGSALDDRLDQPSGVWTGFVSPADKSRGTPFRIFLVCRRHMFFEGGVLMGHKASDMAGHALALSQGLHGVGGQAHVELFALQLMRHAVVVIVDFDVVVDVDGGDLPLGVFVELSVAMAKRWADRREQRVRGAIV